MVVSIKAIVLSSNLFVILLNLRHGVIASEVNRLGSSNKSVDKENKKRELNIFGSLGGAFNNVGNGIGGALNDMGNGIGDAVGTVGNGVSSAVNEVGNGVNSAVNDVGNGVVNAVNDIGNGVDNVVNTVGSGLNDAVDEVRNFANSVGNEINNAADQIGDAINDVIGIFGLGQRCGLGGACDDGLQCEGGALTGLCLPVKCIADNVMKHATYFDRLLNTENGGGVEYAKNYTTANLQERNAIGNDFSTCFSGDSGRMRNLAGSPNPIHAIGAIGEASLIASSTFYYMYVFPDGTVDNRAANIIGVCGGAGIGGGISLKPMYDMIFADSANDVSGTWTFARFEIAFPIPPVTLGFGIHVGVNAGDLFDVVQSPPIFDLRITLILPGIGGIGANFASIAACQAVNAG